MQEIVETLGDRYADGFSTIARFTDVRTDRRYLPSINPKF